MLKSLELIGFKSFADKTTIEFAAGITAIVGPNGSGKSNLVDAVRWILGEQSAKSLRGGEMADVIFNGSSSRKRLGMADVTVTFDNARNLLAVDADEVRDRRRVYRDGAGEDLVNGQMSRLEEEVAGAAARAEELEQTARARDWEVGKAEEALRHQEARLADARQQIAGFDATLKHERAATADQEAELLRSGRKQADLGYRLK